jgi:hypothetical protein
VPPGTAVFRQPVQRFRGRCGCTPLRKPDAVSAEIDIAHIGTLDPRVYGADMQTGGVSQNRLILQTFEATMLWALTGCANRGDDISLLVACGPLVSRCAAACLPDLATGVVESADFVRLAA